MLRYKLFKIRDGKESKLRAWADELKSRAPEVIATLVYENVLQETMYIVRCGDAAFVMGIQSISGEHQKADMSVELNQRHFAILKECLEPVDGETLYSFSRETGF